MDQPEKTVDAGPEAQTRPDAGGDDSRGEQQQAPKTKPGLWRRLRQAHVLRWTGLLLLVIGLVVSFVWALHAKNQARAASQEADKERQRARAAEKQVKEERSHIEAARQQAAKERDEARAEVAAAKRTADHARGVVDFLQDKLLAAGRPAGWSEGYWADPPAKKMTLREAIDGAAKAVPKSLADRPLVEAEVREVLGSAYFGLGEASEAARQYERALALREAKLGPDAPETVACRNKLAYAERRAGHPTEAARLYNQNPDTFAHAEALAIRGRALLTEKNARGAEAKLRESLTILEKLRPDEWTTFNVKSALGDALLREKKYAEAEPLLLAGYRGLRQRQAKIPPQEQSCIATALERIVNLYEAWGKTDEAARWRQELDKSQ